MRLYIESTCVEWVHGKIRKESGAGSSYCVCNLLPHDVSFPNRLKLQRAKEGAEA
jgi:hypothetical protein